MTLRSAVGRGFCFARYHCRVASYRPAGERVAHAVGDWVERWLSAERFATYLAAAGGDRGRALRLYEWNVQVGGALFHDLAHPRSPLFAPTGARHDANVRFREQLAEARRAAAQSASGGVRHGDVVAQLPFGFWRFLGAKAHEKALWVPYLHTAFPPGTDRRADVDEPLVRLHRVRNRIAHHEPLLKVNLTARLHDVVTLAGRLDPELGRYVATWSTTARCVASRP